MGLPEFIDCHFVRLVLSWTYETLALYVGREHMPQCHVGVRGQCSGVTSLSSTWDLGIDRTQVIRLCSKHLCLSSHLTGLYSRVGRLGAGN